MLASSKHAFQQQQPQASREHSRPLAYVVCGPSGCGKSTVGRLLADTIIARFYDADGFHSASNISKIRTGMPLTDDDRWPWLQQLAAILRQHVQQHTQAVLACSALKQSYRQVLASAGSAASSTPGHGLDQHDPAAGCSLVNCSQLDADSPAIVFVLLNPGREQLLSRVAQRSDHFMPVSLLDSQLRTLEANGVQFCFTGSEPPEEIVATVLRGGGLHEVARGDSGGGGDSSQSHMAGPPLQC